MNAGYDSFHELSKTVTLTAVSSPDTTMSKQFSKRSKPPNIDIGRVFDRRPVIQIHQADDSPLEDTVQLSDDDELHLSSSSSSSPTSSIGPTGNDGDSGDLSRDLAALQQLRKSVKTNLRLRPIRSNNALPKVNLSLDPLRPSISPKSPSFTSSPSAQSDSLPLSSSSPTSADSNYFTPLTGRRLRTPSTADSSPTWDADLISRPIPPGILYVRLTSSTRPLLIDTRPLALHLASHIRHSINIAIPTLILKRSRKLSGGFQTLVALRQFITTEEGKNAWDELMQPDGPWDGDVVVHDDEMDLKDKDDIRCTAWALIPILAPLLKYGFVNYLEGGICVARHHPDLEMLITSSSDPSTSDDPAPPRTPLSGEFKKGLFQLDTGTALRSKPLPEIETSPASNVSSPLLPLPSLPVIPVMPPTTSSLPHKKPRFPKTSPLLSQDDFIDSSPSPPPSQLTFRKAVPPYRRPSVPNLRRLDTNGVSGLSIRTKPMRSATLAVPPSHLSLQVPTSPSHLNLVHSNYSPPGSARLTFTTPPQSAVSATYGSPDSAVTPQEMTPYYTPPHTPFTPKPPSSPMTPRPMLETFLIGADESPPSSEEGYPTFTVSTILPNFLYLGPELTTQEHVDELQELGVKRILNIATECDDDHGLRLREVFERYIKIPMRDTVEEDNIAWGVREVCNFLDDARLHSAPTYVHCRAGKSRSVTAVMAYLIHANHWTLARAYAFVLERRKGISPNIGFVSELMTFEEQELGGKSVGVQSSASGARSAQGNGTGEKNGGPTGQQGDAYTMAAHHQPRRGGHVRESLPPALSTAGMSDGLPGSSIGPMSAGGMILLGDSAHEREIKDADGRYRHARRVPVDETTLQPGRRVSKAGLESLIGT